MQSNDIENTKLLSLTEAAAIVPTTNGKPASTSTVWRWCKVGIGGIRLKYLRCGGRLSTTQKDVIEFFEKLTEADEAKIGLTPPPRQAHPRTLKQRETAINEARSTLAEAGL